MEETELLAQLRRSFPELSPELDDGISTGLLHCEMGVLADFARCAIARRDLAGIGRAFAFAEMAFRLGSPDIRNAVYVSFLENTLLDASTPAELEAEGLLPPVLKVAPEELRSRWADLERHAADRQRDTPR